MPFEGVNVLRAIGVKREQLIAAKAKTGNAR